MQQPEDQLFEQVLPVDRELVKRVWTAMLSIGEDQVAATDFTIKCLEGDDYVISMEYPLSELDKKDLDRFKEVSPARVDQVHVSCKASIVGRFDTKITLCVSCLVLNGTKALERLDNVSGRKRQRTSPASASW